MKKTIIFSLLILLVSISDSFGQPSGTEVYFITCSPGSESYSMYGHSALRLVDTVSGTDLVYNWGVFDFTTPNFTYKFARGRLDYMLGVYPYSRFLKDYFNEERSVYSQKVNLDEEQVLRLKQLLAENLKPENISYRYDFFMDNCATRIRDIIENVAGSDLLYPDIDAERQPSYRDRIDEYQRGRFIWLDMGIDILLGSPADDECGFRGSMFLPDYLQSNLSETMLLTMNGELPLLQAAETVIEFDNTDPRPKVHRRPWFVLSLIALILVVITFRYGNKLFQNIFDQLFFILMFLMAFLMIFTNYLTDHDAMGNNFNMVWLNPLLLIAPFVIFMKRPFDWLWRTIIALSVLFMLLIVFIPQTINGAFIPVILILIARSYARLKAGKF